MSDLTPLHTPHHTLHATGGADAFTSADVLEAAAMRLRETSGPTILAVGAIADGQSVVRSGSTLVGSSASSEAAANKVLRCLSFA